MNKVGFVMFLIGCGGLAESYGNTRQMVISIVLAGIGITAMRLCDEKVHSDMRTDNGNVLDRLRFLP